MAHGFLSYETVSGESPLVNFAKKKLKEGLKSLWGKFQKTSGSLVKSSGGQVQYDANPQGVTVRDVTKPEPAARRMLSGSSAKAFEPGIGSITQKEPMTVPGGTGGGIAKKPGGSYTELPGVAAASGGLNAETFFKQATTGVGASGEYLTNAQRREAFIKSRQESVKTSASAAAAPPISPDSGIDIVAAVNRNTQMIVSLVDAVKAQTKNDSNLVEKQIQGQETLMLRAAARREEEELEQGSDLSGFMTPENFAKRKKNEEKKETGSKLKEFFRGPNPFKKDGGCGCSPFMPGPGGRGPILGGPPGGGGLPFPDFVDEYRDMNRRPGSRLGGGGSVTRRVGGGRRATRLATKIGGKGAGKAVAKGLGKFGAKRIPGLGLLAGIAFGAERAMKGDFLGAAGEVASGALGPAGFAIDAGLAARDAGLTPFANGGIITQPVAGLVGEAGNEGIFPLEGKRGEKTFRMFGEGVFQAQKDNDKDFAKLQSMGLKQYYEREGGFKKMAEGLKDFFAGLGGVFSNIFNSLTGGTANAATGNPADYLDGGGIGGSTAERNAAAFLSTLEGGSGQNAADTFQVMLNRTANAKKGGAMKAYGNTLFDQITAQSQFSPFSAAIHDKATGDRAADKKYGAIRSKLGKNAAERKAKLLEIAGQPDGIAQLQRLFNAGSATEASKILKDFETGGTLSKESAKGVRGAVSFRGQSLIGNMKAGDFYRGTGGNFFFNGLGGQAAGLSAVSAEPPSGAVLNTGRLPALPKTGTMHGQAYGAARDSGRKHAGVDFDISGNEKFFSRLGGEVIFAGWGGAGYGNTVDIYNKDLNVTERIAEGAKLLVSQGATVKPGTAVTQGESKTGVIHYEIRKGRATASGSFEGTLNPLNFLSSLSSKNKDTAGGGGGGGGAPAAAQVNRGGQRGGGSSPGSLQASAANPNTGTPMMATSQQVAMASTGGGAAPTIINNYYGGGGQSGGVNPNGVAPGIGMEQTGTSVFQDLRIRALA